MLRHFGNARLVKQVRAVGQAATESVVQIGHFQVEVELGGAGIVRQKLNGHACQLTALLERPALHVAHHLKQGVIRRATWGLQRFNQVVERQVLVGLPLDDGLAHLLNQLAYAHLPVQLTAQHLGI